MRGARCSLLIDELDEMIVKALSWALRALVARAPEAVRQFIEENDARLPALVRREVRQEAGDRAKESEIVSTQRVQLAGAMRLAVLHCVFLDSH